MTSKLRKARQKANVDMGPFSDIAFLLIIFFILVTSLTHPMAQKLEVPASSEVQEETKQEFLCLEINVDQLKFGANAQTLSNVTFEQLEKKIEELKLDEKADEDQRVVTVKINGEVRYGFFVETVLMISRLGGIPTLIEEVIEEKVVTGVPT